MADDFDPQKLAGLLIPDQSTLDKALATGNITRVSPAALVHQTDWNGLTPQQEREKEAERQSQKRQEEILAEAEFEQTMRQVHDQADRMMTKLDSQDRALRTELAEIKARPIVLADGRRVRIGPNGEPLDDVTGQSLQGKDKAEAQRQQQQKEKEEKEITDRLARDEEAREHLRRAQSISTGDGSNLTPEQKKEKETEAQNELARAQAIAGNVEAREKHIERDAAAASTLNETDTLAALGLGTSCGSGRTTSFAASMDGKDSRSTALQNEFIGVTRQSVVAPPAPAAVSADNSLSAGTIQSKQQISQPNQ